MRVQQEQSDADTLVYIDIKKIASEINRLEEEEIDVATDDFEVLDDVDVVDSLRGSEASIPPQVPAKPSARAPLAVFVLLIGLAILALQAGKPALAGGRSRLDTLVMGVRGRLGAATARWLAPAVQSPSPPAPISEPAPQAPSTAGAAPVPQRAAVSSVSSMPRADATLDRARGSFSEGVFEILPDFASEDGGYDLIVHFHGGASVVAPEFARARMNAVLVVVNLGLSSGSYDQNFTSSLLFPTILSHVTRTLTERGLRTPSLRRLALTAWSAGYAAVKRILDEPGAIERIDSVILLDGLHTAFLAYPKRPDPSHLTMFVRFAKEAVAGRKLLSITHSEIDPFEFVGAHKSTDLLLSDVGVVRRAVAPEAASASAETVNPAKVSWPMELTSEAHEGGLFVRGYGGTTKADHCAHVGQMANTALPDLAKRWASAPRPAE
jgi:hypothetical protein